MGFLCAKFPSVVTHISSVEYSPIILYSNILVFEAANCTEIQSGYYQDDRKNILCCDLFLSNLHRDEVIFSAV